MKEASHRRINIAGSHFYEAIKIIKFIETEWKVSCQGLGRGVNGELLFNRYRVSVYKMKRIIVTDGGDGYTTM